MAILKLNELSETELNELADKVEAMKPWKCREFYFCLFFRRFMVTIWALVLFPFIAHPVFAIVLIVLAFLYDWKVVAKAEDMQLTVRDVVFELARKWDDTITEASHPKGVKSWKGWIVLILGFNTIISAIVSLSAAGIMPTWMGQWLMAAATIIGIGWYSRYGTTYLTNIYEPFQIAIGRIKRGVMQPHIAMAPALPITFLLCCVAYPLSLFRIRFWRWFSILFPLMYAFTLVIILNILFYLIQTFFIIEYERIFTDKIDAIEIAYIFFLGTSIFFFIPVGYMFAQKIRYTLVSGAIGVIYQLIPSNLTWRVSWR